MAQITDNLHQTDKCFTKQILSCPLAVISKCFVHHLTQTSNDIKILDFILEMFCSPFSTLDIK